MALSRHALIGSPFTMLIWWSIQVETESSETSVIRQLATKPNSSTSPAIHIFSNSQFLRSHTHTHTIVFQKPLFLLYKSDWSSSWKRELERESEMKPDWELQNCCDKDQKLFLATVGVFTLVILAVSYSKFSRNLVIFFVSYSTDSSSSFSSVCS